MWQGLSQCPKRVIIHKPPSLQLGGDWPLAVICDKDDNKPAPGSNDNPYKAWEEYYESVSFFGITRD